MKQIDIEVYSEQADILGEGPIWSMSEQTLFWLDIARKLLYRRGLTDERPTSWSLSDHPGCLAEFERGTVAIAMGEGVQRLNLQSGATDLIYSTSSRRPGTRFNDGKVDPVGRFWAGTMQNNFGSSGEPIDIERADGALFRFDLNGSASVIEENVGVANTLAWSPDLKHFYFADSLKDQIYTYDFEAELGSLRNKRIFFESSCHGVPDGSAMDVDGCLWNARWDGGAVLRITPDGKLDRIITMPVLRPTSCAFGGLGMQTLFVTSARIGLAAPQLAQHPLSGSVFAIHGIGQGMKVPPMLLESSR
jgi:sugar lactone lactonase YvrE